NNLLLIANLLASPEGQAGLSSSINTVGLMVQLGLIMAGLLFSALFSGSEVAFFSLNSQSELSADNDRDQLIMRMLDRPRRLLATILIGNTFANIVTSVLAAVVTGSLAGYLGFSQFWIYFWEIIVLTFTILILSE